MTTLSVPILLSSALLALSHPCFNAFAQPHYTEISSLPWPDATDRTELLDPQTHTWFTFPSFYMGNMSLVYYAPHSDDGNLNWTLTTSFPTQTTYWGRAATYAKKVYFTGTFDNVSMYADIFANGTLGSWQSMTGLPTPPGGMGRALHQAFTFSDHLYIIGGWHGDGLPAYDDVYSAPILGSGAVGQFSQTVSLPVGAWGHSAVVSADGKVYVCSLTNLFLGKLGADGSISSWVKQSTISGLDHSNYGNVGIALLPNRLVIVDATRTFICDLDDTGQMIGLESTLINPATFAQRSVYEVGGKTFVTATTGKMYRIDGLPPSPPILSIRISQIELCWESDQATTYQMQYRSTLTGDQWVNIGSPIQGNGTRLCITDSVPVDSPKRFYQLSTMP